MNTDTKFLTEAYMHIKEAELGKPLVYGQPVDMSQYKRVSEIGKENIKPNTPLLYLSNLKSRYNKIVLRSIEDPKGEPNNIGVVSVDGPRDSWFHANVDSFWVKEDDI